MEITKATTAETTTYSMIIDGEQVSFLNIDAATRKVTNIETLRAHQGEGYARALWEHANAEAECFHALPHHRSQDGDAFAEAVGGETIDAEYDFIDVCCVCTGEL